MLKIKGIVVAVAPERSGVSKAGKAWCSIEFTIRHGSDQYPKHASFTLFNERCEQCPIEGEEVEIEFIIDARGWQGKWFNSLIVFKITSEQMPELGSQKFYDGNGASPLIEDKDDLPF